MSKLAPNQFFTQLPAKMVNHNVQTAPDVETHVCKVTSRFHSFFSKDTEEYWKPLSQEAWNKQTLHWSTFFWSTPLLSPGQGQISVGSGALRSWQGVEGSPWGSCWILSEWSETVPTWVLSLRQVCARRACRAVCADVAWGSSERWRMPSTDRRCTSYLPPARGSSHPKRSARCYCRSLRCQSVDSATWSRPSRIHHGSPRTFCAWPASAFSLFPGWKAATAARAARPRRAYAWAGNQTATRRAGPLETAASLPADWSVETGSSAPWTAAKTRVSDQDADPLTCSPGACSGWPRLQQQPRACCCHQEAAAVSGAGSSRLASPAALLSARTLMLPTCPNSLLHCCPLCPILPAHYCWRTNPPLLLLSQLPPGVLVQLSNQLAGSWVRIRSASALLVLSSRARSGPWGLLVFCPECEHGPAVVSRAAVINLQSESQWWTLPFKFTILRHDTVRALSSPMFSSFFFNNYHSLFLLCFWKRPYPFVQVSQAPPVECWRPLAVPVSALRAERWCPLVASLRETARPRPACASSGSSVSPCSLPPTEERCSLAGNLAVGNRSPPAKSKDHTIKQLTLLTSFQPGNYRYGSRFGTCISHTEFGVQRSRSQKQIVSVSRSVGTKQQVVQQLYLPFWTVAFWAEHPGSQVHWVVVSWLQQRARSDSALRVDDLLQPLEFLGFRTAASCGLLGACHADGHPDQPGWDRSVRTSHKSPYSLK